MLKPNEQLQFIKKRIIEVCPEIMELTTGCKVKIEEFCQIDVDEFGTSTGIVVRDFTKIWVSAETQPVKNNIVWKTFDYEELKKNYDIETVGHPITLSHVLRAIEKKGGYHYWIGTDGHFYELNTNFGNHELGVMAIEGSGIYWDLAKYLDSQKPEVWEFLFNLLK